MSGILLQVENLTIRYRDAAEPAVRELCFQLAEGESLSLHGPSGAGQSTVAWALMGMLEAYRAIGTGRITFAGETVDLEESPRGLRRSWREIALVPQSSMSALNPVRTVEQTMLEMMEAHEGRGSRRERIRRCEALLQLVRLDAAVLHSYPHELSGGMRQRLSIALAVMYHPRLLILDEATTGLDLLVEADILGTIRKLREREGMSILMITHDRRLADAFCSRRVEIGGGHG